VPSVFSLGVRRWFAFSQNFLLPPQAISYNAAVPRRILVVPIDQGRQPALGRNRVSAAGGKLFTRTMIYTHVLNKPGLGICSPLDDDNPRDSHQIYPPPES